MASIKELTDRKPWINWVIFLATVVIVFYNRVICFINN